MDDRDFADMEINSADANKCEGCCVLFADEVRFNVTADDVWLCDDCWADLMKANQSVKS
jgi:hypothetical protein